MKHNKALQFFTCCTFFLLVFLSFLYFLLLSVQFTTYFKDFLRKDALRTGSASGAVLKVMALCLGFQVVELTNNKCRLS